MLSPIEWQARHPEFPTVLTVTCVAAAWSEAWRGRFPAKISRDRFDRILSVLIDADRQKSDLVHGRKSWVPSQPGPIHCVFECGMSLRLGPSLLVPHEIFRLQVQLIMRAAANYRERVTRCARTVEPRSSVVGWPAGADLRICFRCRLLTSSWVVPGGIRRSASVSRFETFITVTADATTLIERSRPGSTSRAVRNRSLAVAS